MALQSITLRVQRLALKVCSAPQNYGPLWEGEHVTSPSEDEKSASGLQAQIFELGKQVQEFTMSADKYFALATTIIVAALTLTITNKFAAAIVALPFALGGILLYVMQLFTERAARAGMRKALEKRLRAHSNYYYAAVSDCLDRAVSQHRLSVVASTALYLSTMVLSSFMSIVSARHMVTALGAWLPGLVEGGILLLGASMIIAYSELARAEKRAYDYALALPVEGEAVSAIVD